MRESYAKFLADHRAEHRSAFNRWCLVAGDAFQIAGVVVALRARWRPAAVTFAIGVGVAVAGHVRDGNVPKSSPCSQSCWSLVSEGVNGAERCGFVRGVEAEEQADHGRDGECEGDRRGFDEGLDADDLDVAHREADDDAENAADESGED